MPKGNKTTESKQAKGSPTRVPESGKGRDHGARQGIPIGGKDDVRFAPESGDKMKDLTSRKR